MKLKINLNSDGNNNMSDKCELCEDETKCRTWDALDGNTKKYISLEIGVNCYMNLVDNEVELGIR